MYNLILFLGAAVFACTAVFAAFAVPFAIDTIIGGKK